MRTNTGKKVRDNSKTDRLPAGDTIFQKEKKKSLLQIRSQCRNSSSEGYVGAKICDTHIHLEM